MSTTTRRFFAVTLLGSAALLSTGAAQAWSWNWGSGERVTGEGEVASERRDVSGYDAVALEGSFKVQIRQGSGHKLELRAERNLLPYIETRVVDGSKGRTLEIGPKKGTSFSTSTTPELSISMAQLRSLSVAGSGHIKVDAMKTGAVEASVAGSGDIQFSDLSSEKLGLRVAGSGDIVARGKTGQLNVSISGSGDVKATETVAEEVKISIAGSGDAKVNAVKKLNVSIAGSGDVAYVGSPEISSSVAGSGKVRRINP